MSAQERFLLLVGPEPGAQAWGKRRLEPMHRGLGKGSAAISVDAFPVRWAQDAVVNADSFYGTVSFERAGIGANALFKRHHNEVAVIRLDHMLNLDTEEDFAEYQRADGANGEIA
jgi:hypothetical protein